MPTPRCGLSPHLLVTLELKEENQSAEVKLVEGNECEGDMYMILVNNFGEQKMFVNVCNLLS